MNTYHVPQHNKKTVKEYFGGIHIKFTVGEFTTSWQQLEKGLHVITGCTILPIFVCDWDESYDNSSRKSRKGTKDEHRSTGIIITRLHG